MATSQNNNPGCLTAILRAFGLKPKDKPVEKLPYVARESVLSAAETSFFHLLHSVVSSNYHICLKMRLADIFQIKTREKYMSYFNKISQRHIDFLVCHPKTVKPILAIELDDSSHSRKKRQERDEFVNKAFKSAGLPLIRISASRTYNTKELVAGLRRYLPELANQNDTQTPNSRIPQCPKCGSQMVVRSVKKGEHKGKQFYLCSTYPECRGALPIS
jgi:hypothetical protein